MSFENEKVVLFLVFAIIFMNNVLNLSEKKKKRTLRHIRDRKVS